MDSTPLRACGRPGHKKDKEAGRVPHTRIDTQAGWTKSGWHGWVYGWKLHIACPVGEVWLPLCAEMTPADEADNVVAERRLPPLPKQARFVLGDSAYNTHALQRQCQHAARTLVASRRTRSQLTNPHGLEVRRVFHALRSQTIETFNSPFKGIFSPYDQVPTKGRVATARFVFGSVLVCQMALWYRAIHKQPLRQGLKPLLRAA